MELYLASRENGGLVQTRDEDGTVHTYRYEDLYPNRARILDAYYELEPAPDVPAPEWEVDTRSGGVGTTGGKNGIGNVMEKVGAATEAALAGTGAGS
jgi:hypothetical protein